MSNLSNTAKQYLSLGLSVIPTKKDKTPTISWKPYQQQRLSTEEAERFFSRAEGIAIITGAVSGSLEVIDVDTKHDKTGTLWGEFSRAIPSDLYSKLVVAQTQSGGYHLYYRAPEIEGNLKLAVKLDKEVLLETRGEGGYVIAPPSSGYKYLQGEPKQISTITSQERQQLLRIARSFTEDAPAPQSKKKATSSGEYPGVSPFEDFNERADIVDLLRAQGWEIVAETPERVHLLRPGDTKSKTSGNYHKGLRLLRVFSSSTDFNPDRAYNPAQVFMILEGITEEKEAYKRLLELGYGTPPEREGDTPRVLKTEKITVTAVNNVNQVTSVIKPGETLSIKHLEGYEEATITAPEGVSEEVLTALEILETQGKRVYIKDPSGEELRSYQYLLRGILTKYGEKQEQTGELSSRDIDRMLEEVVQAASKLSPIDRERFNKEFTSLEAIQELGISKESLELTVERITATRAKEKQDSYTQKLLEKAEKIRKEGDSKGALNLLSKGLKAVEAIDREPEFSKLLVPTSEDTLREALSGAKDSLNTGYTIAGEPLELPAGALSIFSAPTSHGKTSFLINLLLQTAQQYPDKEFYLFSYEESGEAILLKTLNTYLDLELSKNNRKTLQSYYKEGTTAFFRKDILAKFQQGAEEYFKTLVASRRVTIVGSSYDSDSLIKAIQYLNKKTDIGGVFIDYFQLLNLPESRLSNYGSRQTELKEICINLKDLAVETGLPITLGAQFNREVTDPLKMHPTRIGEAGDIERIANLLVGFWNTAFKPALEKGRDSKMQQVLQEIGLNLGVPGTLYLEVMKNRDGVAGVTERFHFNGNTGRISNRREEIDPFR